MRRYRYFFHSFTLNFILQGSNFFNYYYYLQERRHDEFASIKKDIVACMSDLEREPETSFEMDVMCEDEEGFCLSDDNIAALKLLLSQVTLNIYII